MQAVQLMDSSSTTQNLSGLRILLTRAETPDSPLSLLLSDAQATVLSWPMIHTQSIPFTMPSPNTLADYDGLLFTSQQGASSFFQQANDIPVPTLFAVGEKTAQCIQQIRQQSVITPKTFDAISAADEWLEKKLWQPGQSILWPCGNLANPELLAWSKTHQIKLIPLGVYETIERTLSKPEQNDFLKDLSTAHCIVFTSPSSIRAFQATGAQVKDRQKIACFGASTKQAALQAFQRCDIIPGNNTFEALFHSIQDYYQTPS